MKTARSLLWVFFLIQSTNALAIQGDTYSGFLFSKVTIDEDPGDTFKPDALIARFGGYITDNVALEFRFGTSAQADSTTYYDPYYGDWTVEIDIGKIHGAYIILSTEDDDPGIYAILGYTEAQLLVQVEDLAGIVEEDDSSWGVGFRYGGLTVEYMQYLNEDAFDATGLNIGFTAEF